MKKPNSPMAFDLGLVLLTTGALANITVWIGAFVSTEAQGAVSSWVRNFLLPVLGGISGTSMGITASVGLIYVLARLGKMKPTTDHKARGKKRYQTVPNVRYYTAWGSIVLLLVISSALLSPYVLMLLSGAPDLYSILGSRWAPIWSVGRIIAADLAVAAVALVYGAQLHAIAGGARPTQTPTGASRSAKGASQSESSAVRTAKDQAKSAPEMRGCEVVGCEMSYRWPQGKGAHYKKYHPDLVIQKGIPARMSLPIKDAAKAEKQ